MLTKTFTLISWHLSIHVSLNNLILQPWNVHLWTGDGSPKPVKTSISIGQASRISPFFCYLISVICDLSPPPTPGSPLLCQKLKSFVYVPARLCLATLNSSGLIQFFRLLRLVCCHLNFWDFPPRRRDPYDYPTRSRPVPRELGPSPGQYSDPPASSRMPIPQSAGQPNNQRYRPSSPSVGRQRPPLRQDVPPTSTVGHRGRQYYEPAGRQLEDYGEASPGRYASPDRYAYSDDNQPDSRRKNPMIGAV